MELTPETLTKLRTVIAAARVAEVRHPNCGAFAWLRGVLSDLPAELRVQIGGLPPHPEDDNEDRAAEVRRLVRENADLRRRLAEQVGGQLDLFAAIRGELAPSTPLTVTRVLTWDYRQQPDIDALTEGIRDLSGGRLYLHQVDTGGDEYAVVLSTADLTDAGARVVWERDAEGGGR